MSQQTAFADTPDHHSVSAQEATREPAAEAVIRDDDLVGQRIVKATNLLYDGHEKTVLIPHGGSPPGRRHERGKHKLVLGRLARRRPRQ